MSSDHSSRFGYVNKLTFTMDLKVLFVTVYKVVKRSDILVGSEIKVGRLDDARRNTNADHTKEI